MPLRSGGAVDNEYARGRICRGLMSMGKARYLYAGYEGSYDGETDVARIAMDPFRKVAERTDIGDNYHQLLPLKQGIYDFSGWADPGKILLLHPLTLATLDSLTLLTGERFIWGNAEKDNYLYAGLSSPTGSEPIIRCTKDPFARVDSLTIGEDAVNATLVIDDDIMYVVLAMRSLPALCDKVVKVDLPSFTKGDVLDLDEDINDNLHPDAVIHEGNLYIGIPKTPGRIVKVDLDTFTIDTKLDLQAGQINARGLIVKDNYMYAGTHNYPGEIAKINLGTFTQVDTLTLPTNEDYVFDMQIHGNILYALLYADNAAIGNYLVRINLATFTRIDSIWLGDEAWFAVDLKIA